jgi:hypothetical protein
MPFSLNTYLTLDRANHRKTRLVRGVVAVSLANICYLRIWDGLFHNPERDYLAATPYNPVDYFAALAGVFLFAALLYVVISVIWYHGSRTARIVAKLAIFIVFLLPLDFVRRSLGASLAVFFGFTSYTITAAMLLALALRFHQRFYAVLFWLLALLSPYAGVNIVQTLAHAISPEQLSERPQLPVPAAKPDSAARNRVVWIIFDEWDQRILFDERPADLKLPHLDRLVGESVMATRAYAPSGRTLISIPALLTGRLIAEAQAKDDDELQIRFSGEKARRDFRSTYNIITEALLGGHRVGIAGWYHPYGRLFPQTDNLTARSFGFPPFQGFRSEMIPDALAAQLQFLISPIYIWQLYRDLHIQLHAAALDGVGDAALDLVFLHYNVPHLPGIYDRERQVYSISRSNSMNEYLGNLALVDRTLGELLLKLDTAGLRDSTTLIVTADHWWRSAPWVEKGKGYPVPLILRAQGGGNSERVEATLCTTSLRTVVRDILAGKCVDNVSLASRLRAEGINGSVTYRQGVAEMIAH